MHAKAKGSASYRFYLLYDKLHREDILAYAYRVCAANGGAAGADGQEFEDIESEGPYESCGKSGTARVTTHRFSSAGAASRR